MQPAFERWIQGRALPTMGTNAGAAPLPFQAWRNFKEAFAPELIARAVHESGRPVKRCIDPFGGSGTTALACQFLGVEPATIEVNPYLADLIEAKLTTYEGGPLVRDFARVLRTADTRVKHDLSRLPRTFVAPGHKDRWIFSEALAQRIERVLLAIEALPNAKHRRFFKALLGGVLVDVSNVQVSGKGRRYRQNWRARQTTPDAFIDLFRARVEQALVEIATYSTRPMERFVIERGDCRTLISSLPRADLAVFSPPYPNSFDYTDVYNVELWMLGYLDGSAANRTLRQSTLASHVQIARNFAARPKDSPTLRKVSAQLHAQGDALWSKWIPAMVDGYFADMAAVLKSLHNRLYVRGEVWAVVGDSLYSNIHIPVAGILAELAPSLGFDVVRSEAFRSMRSSAQQGFRPELEETLLILRKAG